jgi:hypothetical protein
VPSLWSYCTGGFEKLAFDILFGRELEVECWRACWTGTALPLCHHLPPEAVPQG